MPSRGRAPNLARHPTRSWTSSTITWRSRDSVSLVTPSPRRCLTRSMRPSKSRPLQSSSPSSSSNIVAVLSMVRIVGRGLRDRGPNRFLSAATAAREKLRTRTSSTVLRPYSSSRASTRAATTSVLPLPGAARTIWRPAGSASATARCSASRPIDTSSPRRMSVEPVCDQGGDRTRKRRGYGVRYCRATDPLDPHHRKSSGKPWMSAASRWVIGRSCSGAGSDPSRA